MDSIPLGGATPSLSISGRLRLGTAALALLAASCAKDPVDGPSEAALAPKEPLSGVLPYLLNRYDSDGDGRVSSVEHGRTALAFSRLDQNGDGFIDGLDFKASPPRAGHRRKDRAMLLVGAHLQADDNGSRLGLEELGLAFDEYDGDLNGLLTEEEFRCRLASPAPGPDLQTPGARRLLEGRDPWAGLLGGIDTDGDTALSRAELFAFHRERGGGAAWQWAEEAEAVGGDQRPLIGYDAPDFTLEPLGGGEPVTLSSFEGDRPVVLIFGSYT